MIEAVMYAALGFLAAMLLALLVLPAVWRRAVRLTTRRIEGAIPVSIAEIQADKDQLRAEFAMSARRLELNVETLQTRTVEQSEQLSKQAAGLDLLQTELDQRTASLAEITAAHEDLAERSRSFLEELESRGQIIDETQAALDAAREELAATRDSLAEAETLSESLRVEKVALNARSDTLSDRIGDLERQLSSTQALLSDDRASLRQTIETLGAERARAEELSTHLSAAGADLTRTLAEVAALTANLESIRAHAAEFERRALSGESAHDDARAELARLAQEAAAARQEADTTARHLRDNVEMLRAEKAMMEGALAQIRDDRARLVAQLETTSGGGSGDASDGEAGEVLRERISDIAAEVARLTAALEGPGSPIDEILARHANGNGTQPAGTVSLADRIRALQAQAARAPSARMEASER